MIGRVPSEGRPNISRERHSQVLETELHRSATGFCEWLATRDRCASFADERA